MKNTTSKNHAYLLLRLAMGTNLLAHGLVRIPKIETFSNWMINLYKEVVLPEIFISSFAKILPFAELTIGIFLIFGLFTYRTCLAGGILMIILIFGSCLVEQWEWVGFQMVYVLFFYLLIDTTQNNPFSIDNLLQK
ncbi:DoxX family membrane protein [Aquimarina megaterium]|uniref:DoxX family membrane protein n=1 Tax=Aquimarina megaterium TaxID=1443666 RepID=UPI00046F9D2D|nr:DoxX family membrane protein [Aquimarina megaterium]